MSFISAASPETLYEPDEPGELGRFSSIINPNHQRLRHNLNAAIANKIRGRVQVEDPAEVERRARLAQVMERYRSLETSKQQNLSKILKVLEDPVTRQSECHRIDELINPPLSSPVDTLLGMTVDKKDPAVSMLDSCKNGRRQ